MEIAAKVVEFVEKNRLCVLGILQSDNNIHSATLHFAYLNTPSFFLLTEKDSKKCESLLNNETQNASLVIGFDEAEFSTFQAEGKVKIISDANALNKAWEVYATKFPKRANLKGDKSLVILEFTPAWWRFSNLKTGTNISSEK